ncbi:MAG: CvpA family protein [Kiloniellales bacterium]|nr:CvpA family protein [Kiloniellales bacterium]
MAVLDVVILVVLAVSALFAFLRGFVHELLAIAAWAGAVAAALYGFTPLAPIVRDLTGLGAMADFGAAMAIFFFVLIILTLLNRLIAKRVQSSSLSTLDRSLGLVFGILRGALLICILWIFVVWAVPSRDFPDWVTEARILPVVEKGASYLYALVPEELQPDDEPDLDNSALDFEQSFQLLVRPEPKSDGSLGVSGYNERERKEMERLIEAQQ